MKINIDTDPAIIEEALQVLSQHLEPSKLMRFLAVCNFLNWKMYFLRINDLCVEIFCFMMENDSIPILVEGLIFV